MPYTEGAPALTSILCQGTAIEGMVPLEQQKAAHADITVFSGGRRQIGCEYVTQEGECSAWTNKAGKLPPCARLFPSERVSQEGGLQQLFKLSIDEMPDNPVDRLRIFGREIKARREGMGLATRELAEKSGITPAYLWMIEKGENPKTERPSRPSYEIVSRLCDVLGIDRTIPFMLTGYEALLDQNG